MLFGKNSDRDPNEAQVVEIIPRMKHEDGYVKLTNMEYPQARETYAVIVSRPWWIYGAEMGFNEYGLVIGNVAVFTREPYRDKGMLGMDMLRLALERTRTARDALRFLISLIEEVGQGGNYSYERKFRYHNSFMIVDPEEAWVLETAGGYWAAKRVRDVYTVSNALTIKDDWDLAHDKLVDHGVKHLGCRRQGFSFADCYSDRVYTRLARGRERRSYTLRRLREKIGELTVWDIVDLLRSHSREPYHPARGSMRDICMHYGGLLRPSQTASSMIVVLKDSSVLGLVTGASNPCLSLYKPVVFGVRLPFQQKNTSNMYSVSDYWWRHEALHRRLHLCYKEYAGEYQREILGIEQKLLHSIVDLFLHNKLTLEKVQEALEEMYGEEERILEKWFKKLSGAKCSAPLLYKYKIKRVSKKARLLL
jgi:dipeptidase